MTLDKEVFNKIYLKSYFKGVFNERKEWFDDEITSKGLDRSCEKLADLFLLEFREVNPEHLFNNKINLKNWLNDKLQNIKLN